MLRPSKIFSSLHQLRHYFQTKVAELVVVPQQANNLRRTAAKQQVALSLQQAFVQKAYQTAPTQQHIVDQKVLLKVIKQHFPIVKVFSSPTLHQRSWQSCQQQQLRTMMSASSSGGSSGVLSWGLPRTATVGVGRSPSFARQFSTTKSPSCATLFQNNASANGGQSNVFAHISSRIFSPAGGKINQNDFKESQPSSLSATGIASFNSSDSYQYKQSSPRIFGTQTTERDMGSLTSLQSDHSDAKHTDSLVDCTSANSIASTTTDSSTSVNRLSQQKRSTKYTNRKDLNSIIEHDDVSSLHSRNPYNHRGSSRKRHHLKHSRLKQFSSGQHYIRKSTDEHSPATDRNSTTDRNGLTSSSVTASTIYLLITLDTLQLSKDKKNNWTTENLSTSFIDSIETMAYEYQIHINYVLKLLDNLQRHGKFRIVARQSELRVYFPVSPKSKKDALDFLYLYNIIDHNYRNQDYFSIVTEDREIAQDNDIDYFSYDPSSNVVGPDYFKDLQAFLDHTDHLIATSPAFNSSRH